MMPDIKVTVVLPIFNVEQYLERCLDSIISQTLRDIEVLCVDDGSTDRSLAILKAYAQRDERIHIYEQANSGAAIARNRGISCARGRFLYFMDPDDELGRRDALERLYTTAVEKNTDVIAFGFEKFEDGTKHSLGTNLYGRYFKDLPEVFSSDQASDRLLTVLTPAPWCKFLRTDFVKTAGLTFQNQPRCNDTRFGYMSLALARRIFVIDEPLYRYRVGRAGSSQSTTTQGAFYVCDAYLALRDALRGAGRYEAFAKNFSCGAFSAMLYTLWLIKDISVMQAYYARVHEEPYVSLYDADLTAADFKFRESDALRYGAFVANKDLTGFLLAECQLCRAS